MHRYSLPYGRANLTTSASLQPNHSIQIQLMGYCLATINARVGRRVLARE